MEFAAFPMDIQVCTFQVGSFNYAINRMVFRDEFIPVEESSLKSVLDYDIKIYPLKSADTHFIALNMNYSVAGFQLVLSRKISFYIITYYLPSGVFVVVSWISFLVSPEVCPIYGIRSKFLSLLHHFPFHSAPSPRPCPLLYCNKTLLALQLISLPLGSDFLDEVGGGVGI